MKGKFLPLYLIGIFSRDKLLLLYHPFFDMFVLYASIDLDGEFSRETLIMGIPSIR